MAQAATVSIGPYLLWIGAFLVLVIGAGLAILAYRRMMLSSRAAESHSGILDSLRKLRESGQMTQAEYDATRRAIASRVAGTPAPAKPSAAGPHVARPGFDLTGAPLPKPGTDNPKGTGGGG